MCINYNNGWGGGDGKFKLWWVLSIYSMLTVVMFLILLVTYYYYYIAVIYDYDVIIITIAIHWWNDNDSMKILTLESGCPFVHGNILYISKYPFLYKLQCFMHTLTDTLFVIFRIFLGIF